MLGEVNKAYSGGCENVESHGVGRITRKLRGKKRQSLCITWPVFPFTSVFFSIYCIYKKQSNFMQFYPRELFSTLFIDHVEIWETENLILLYLKTEKHKNTT